MTQDADHANARDRWHDLLSTLHSFQHQNVRVHRFGIVHHVPDSSVFRVGDYGESVRDARTVRHRQHTLSAVCKVECMSSVHIFTTS